jgi:hypothetical protein
MTPATPYSISKIAAELDATALGEAYYGNALRVAKDIPEVTPDERSLLDRWATGLNSPSDRFRLQDLAIKLRTIENDHNPKLRNFL